MSSERHRLRVFSALLVAALVVSSGCNEEQRPLRVGVVVDCVGSGRALRDAELSGAQLPLIERGAERNGRRTRDGIGRAEVGGRPVELISRCTEGLEFSSLTRELRRLAEVDKVDAVVGATTGPDEVVMRDLARTHPEVVFLPVVHGPREVTLQEGAPNLYRFAGDYGQGAAGLATHAFRELGWRRAAVVIGNWFSGWAERDAFVAEFCALGGRVTEQIALNQFDARGRDVSQVPRNVDGVAVFSGQFFAPAAFITRLAARLDDPAGELVVGPGVVDAPEVLRATGSALTGVVSTSQVDPARMREFLRRYARAFPGSSTGAARSEVVTGYRDAVEALMQALERAGGSSERLPAELARLRLELLGGPVRLDGNRQAVSSTSLVRIRRASPAGEEPVLTSLGRIDDVDQSVGGLLEPSHEPSSNPTRCARGQAPPSWAR
jgi:branched-chain amino acid transport system substrate-binding protein